MTFKELEQMRLYNHLTEIVVNLNEDDAFTISFHSDQPHFFSQIPHTLTTRSGGIMRIKSASRLRSKLASIFSMLTTRSDTADKLSPIIVFTVYPDKWRGGAA